ncbi:MAG: precorrin-2 C(20)-methyltransferase [Alphaproteobacteria bacterium]|nr:precorrin-2 C(20)-methyltransferase [Alphaproteobacteria bacterium]
MTATLYGIGVGPGDPDLITLKAQQRLQQCPVIAYPAPVGKNSLAYRIAAPYVPSQATHLRFDIPTVADTEALEAAYDLAAQNIAKHLESGNDVGCICEGDPMFYGSFIYLMQRLQLRFTIEIIPGVSSIMAGASVLQQPLTVHNQHLLIIPGTLPRDTLKQQLSSADVAVIMKVGRHFEKICQVLTEIRRFEHSHYIAYATMNQQHHCPLSMVKITQIPYFSLIYVCGTYDL